MTALASLAQSLCGVVNAQERLTAHQRHCRRLNECEICMAMDREARRERACYFALADGDEFAPGETVHAACG